MTKANRFSQEEIVDFIQNLSDNERLMVFQEVCDAREQGKKDTIDTIASQTDGDFALVRKDEQIKAYEDVLKDAKKYRVVNYGDKHSGYFVERLEQRIAKLKAGDDKNQRGSCEQHIKELRK
jgi:hypothetical protein